MKSTDVNLIGKHVLSGLFHFSFFCFMVKVTKKEKKMSCLFIFCIKNLHFAWKWQPIFSFLVTLTKKQKMKNWMNPTIKYKAWAKEGSNCCWDAPKMHVFEFESAACGKNRLMFFSFHFGSFIFSFFLSL